MFTSRNQLTEHCKELHDCFTTSRRGDRYFPFPPDQLAEGKACRIAREVEFQHRQQRREREAAGLPLLPACFLPPRDRGRGIRHVEAVATDIRPAPGTNLLSFLPTDAFPAVGRGRYVRETLEWATRSPHHPSSTYPLPPLPSTSSVLSDTSGPSTSSAASAPPSAAATLPPESVEPQSFVTGPVSPTPRTDGPALSAGPPASWGCWIPDSDAQSMPSRNRPPLSPSSSETSFYGFEPELAEIDMNLDTNIVIVNALDRQSTSPCPSALRPLRGWTGRSA